MTRNSMTPTKTFQKPYPKYGEDNSPPRSSLSVSGFPRNLKK
jgi:hypothetical protein